jgi:hypothetical protein
MKRTKHNLSHYHLTSCDMGDLVPISCVDVLPGDSIQMATSALIRVTPQMKPVMHPVAVHIKHFFVPFRLIWSGWEDFITGESATPPPVAAGASHNEGTVKDYLGIYSDLSNETSMLHVRAYNRIYNDWFRDKDLVSELSENNTQVQKVAWGKDLFTTARPWPQKGDAVTLPVGTRAPVKGLGIFNQGTPASGTISESGETSSTTDDGWVIVDSTPTGNQANLFVNEDDDNSSYPDIYADLSDANAIDIRDFREAFALQRYQEARARYGSSYVDYLRYLGVRPSDARLQQSEYLGGGRQTLSFSEVLNTASNGGTDAIGELGGHGIGALRTNQYRKYFEEHGVVMTMMYVRPKSIYVNNLPRKFSKTTKEDYFQRELELVGAQEVLNKEIYAAHSDPEGTFGYSNRYQEYREEPSRVSAEFRNSKSYDWHFGRIFDSDPALNPTFIECDPTKRVFAEQTNHSLWVMVNNSIQARRQVGPSGQQSRII